MRRRDVPTALLASAAGSALLASNAQAQACTLPCYPVTAAETGASVTPVNLEYPPGYVYRYGTNTTPGTTDMTTAINNCAKVCRAGRYTLMLAPETCLVSSTLDFSGIRVEGQNMEQGPNILASAAQFDVIKSTGGSTFMNFGVRGGWDGITVGQQGDVFSLRDPGGDGFAYTISFVNVGIGYAKKRGIYWEKGGYGSLYRVQCNASGLHGIELYGNTAAQSTTTIWIGGCSVFTSCPNGYGAVLTDCIMCSFDHVIMEATGGIKINGNDNRSLSFNRVYQEFGSGDTFIDLASSSGIGLSVTNCIGGLKRVTYPATWQNVHYAANSLLAESAIPLAGRAVIADGGEQVTNASGGTSVTAASASLLPGTWLVMGTLQTVVNSGTPALSAVSCVLTTDPGNSGEAIGTGAGFLPGTDKATYNPGWLSDQRLNCSLLFQNTGTSTVTLYLRSLLTFSPGFVAYRGQITAIKMQ
jgi:hypothetical protein